MFLGIVVTSVQKDGFVEDKRKASGSRPKLVRHFALDQVLAQKPLKG
ncbi:hypothetical protein RISK_005544 [Rhodopirellula islandica]|uniref:Uncharacterized protein n=1 Tax=Rhodopirellula islandica TaxID=595434 RepID=A0A0J1B7C7_RHOIS|nr:hypothetical protein RISK_005544 [Rhodopirellula islandica]